MSLKSIQALLIDLSGTIHVENSVVPGSIEAINKLRKAEIPFKFVTNTTKESQKRLHQRLLSLDFNVKSEEVFSSLTAAKNLISTEKLNPMLLLEEEALEDFKGLVDDSQPKDSVVIGLAPSHFHYERLNSAFQLLVERKDAKLIAIHKAKYFKRSNGLALGPGCFVSGLEFSTGKLAQVVGKPEADFFLSAISNLVEESNQTLNTSDVLMIGDDLTDDVLGAQRAGLKNKPHGGGLLLTPSVGNPAAYTAYSLSRQRPRQATFQTQQLELKAPS